MEGIASTNQPTQIITHSQSQSRPQTLLGFWPQNPTKAFGRDCDCEWVMICVCLGWDEELKSQDTNRPVMLASVRVALSRGLCDLCFGTHSSRT
jgi:hypothetical protein